MLRRRMMKKETDYSLQYFTLKALRTGSFSHSRFSVDYSIDEGKTWTTLQTSITETSSTPTVQAGTKVMFRGTITPGSGYGVGTFASTGDFEAEGNVMSLLYGDNFVGQVDLTGKDYAFQNLFYGASYLQNAGNLSLPATTLVRNCYNTMFTNCASLITPPKLPATTLTERCYYAMFHSCTSLTSAPELPAKTLLPYCYASMFYNCASLTTAPELLATTLVSNCYDNMFLGCTNLNYIKAMFTTTPSNLYTNYWVYNVASSGTFVKNSAATWNVIGNNGIPSGWTVQTANN